MEWKLGSVFNKYIYSAILYGKYEGWNYEKLEFSITNTAYQIIVDQYKKANKPAENFTIR